MNEDDITTISNEQKLKNEPFSLDNVIQPINTNTKTIQETLEPEVIITPSPHDVESDPIYTSQDTQEVSPTPNAYHIEMRCVKCNRTDCELKTCSACKAVYYCSREHQKADWKFHKRMCKSLKLLNESIDRRGNLPISSRNMFRDAKKIEEHLQEYKNSKKYGGMRGKGGNMKVPKNHIQSIIARKNKKKMRKMRKKKKSKRTTKKVFIREKLKVILRLLNSRHRSEKLQGLFDLNALLTQTVPEISNTTIIDMAIEIGCLPAIMNILLESSCKLQQKGCLCLTNLAAGNSDHTRSIVKAGAVPLLIDLIGSMNEEVVEQSIWTLANIGTDAGVEILENKGLVKLCSVINGRPRKDILKTAAWAVSTLCVYLTDNKGKFSNLKYTKIVVKAFVPILNYDDESILVEVCNGLFKLSKGDKRISIITDVLRRSGLERLVKLLEYDSVKVRKQVMDIIGNIASGNAKHVRFLMSANIVPALRKMLYSNTTVIRKEACRAFSNIIIDGTDHMQMVIDHKCAPVILKILANSMEHVDVREEAAWVIYNMLSTGSESQQKYLCTLDWFNPLYAYLKYERDGRVWKRKGMAEILHKENIPELLKKRILERQKNEKGIRKSCDLLAPTAI